MAEQFFSQENLREINGLYRKVKEYDYNEWVT